MYGKSLDFLLNFAMNLKLFFKKISLLKVEKLFMVDLKFSFNR